MSFCSLFVLMIEFETKTTNDFAVIAPKNSNWSENYYVLFNNLFADFVLGSTENLITTTEVNSGEASFTIEKSIFRDCTFTNDLILLQSKSSVISSSGFASNSNANSDIKNLIWSNSNTNISSSVFYDNLQKNFQEVRLIGLQATRSSSKFVFEGSNITRNNFGDGIGIMGYSDYSLSYSYCGFVENALYRLTDSKDSYLKNNAYPALIYLFAGTNTVKHCNFIDNTVNVNLQSIIHSCYFDANSRADKIQYCYMNNINKMPTKGYEIRLSVSGVSILGTCFGSHCLSDSNVKIGQSPIDTLAPETCNVLELMLPGIEDCAIPAASPTPSPSHSPHPSPSESPHPSPSESPHPSPSESPHPSPSHSPHPSPSHSPHPSPSESVFPSSSPNPSPEYSPFSTVTESVVPTLTESPYPSLTETPCPSMTETVYPSITGTLHPSLSDSPIPSQSFVPTPTVSMSVDASYTPPRSYPENYNCVQTVRKGLLNILPLKKLIPSSMALLLCMC